MGQRAHHRAKRLTERAEQLGERAAAAASRSRRLRTQLHDELDAAGASRSIGWVIVYSLYPVVRHAEQQADRQMRRADRAARRARRASERASQAAGGE